LGSELKKERLVQKFEEASIMNENDEI